MTNAIIAARALGLGSTPMIGFDAEAVAREFAGRGRSARTSGSPIAIGAAP